MGPWLLDIESFEQVSQDETSRRLVLRMAQLYREGRLEPFVNEVAYDPNCDDDTRAAITELIVYVSAGNAEADGEAVAAALPRLRQLG